MGETGTKHTIETIFARSGKRQRINWKLNIIKYNNKLTKKWKSKYTHEKN